MRTSKVIHVVSCHAAGEVGDVIVGGVVPPPGDSIWDQARFIAEDQTLRNFLLNEPRGGVFRHVNLLVPAKAPDADFGWIIMEPADTPPMSGSNSMCVSTVLLETGLVEMHEPVTHIKLEPPGGVIDVTAECRNGKVERVSVRNVASYADNLGANLEISGVGTLVVDTAYGGDSFVIVDAEALGLTLHPDEARDIAELGVKITSAANEQLGFSHPIHRDWNHLSFCQFAGPIAARGDALVTTNAVAIRPGKVDRSPCGTGCSARMAVLHAKGLLRTGQMFIGRSIIGSEFECYIDAEIEVGSRPGVLPVISGSAWITGVHQHMLDPSDPFPGGYRVSDTWPSMG